MPQLLSHADKLLHAAKKIQRHTNASHPVLLLSSFAPLGLPTKAVPSFLSVRGGEALDNRLRTAANSEMIEKLLVLSPDGLAET